MPMPCSPVPSPDCSRLPGADWWVAGGVNGAPATGDIDLDHVEALYTNNGLWPAVFDLNP